MSDSEPPAQRVTSFSLSVEWTHVKLQLLSLLQSRKSCQPDAPGPIRCIGLKRYSARPCRHGGYATHPNYEVLPITRSGI